MQNAKENFILSFYTALCKDVAEITRDCPVLSRRHTCVYLARRIQYAAQARRLTDIWSEFERNEPGSGFAAIATVGKAIEVACITNTRLKLPAWMRSYSAVHPWEGCERCGKSEDCGYGADLHWNPCTAALGRVSELQYGDLIHPFGSLFSTLFDDYGFTRLPLNKADEENQALAFYCLRQIFLAFSKVKDVEPNVSVEDEIESFRLRVTTRPDIVVDSRILGTARKLLRDVLGNDDELCAGLASWETQPWGAHGPGAVAEGEEGQEKWDLRGGLHSFRDEVRISATPDEGNVTECYVPIEELFNYTSRLAIVPKDYRGHRLICIEQKELMFAQQGVWRTIADVVHSHPLASRAIDFTDQTRSMVLSKNRRFATIDLKDASDRVSLPLLRLLFPRSFMKLVGSLRSRSIICDGAVLVEEGKLVTAFTMGNALCFPVETLCFWALSLATMICKDPRQAFPGGISQALDGLTNRELVSSEWLRRYPLRVFGDDIVVPNRFASDVVETLEACGLTVNREKTCIAPSPVREACGAFWFLSRDVAVTKLSFHDLCSRSAWVSLVESARHLTNGGFHHCAYTLTNYLAEIRPVARNVLGFPSQGVKCEWVRWNTDYQRIELLVPRLDNGVAVRLPGRAGLYAWWTKQATHAVLSPRNREVAKEEWVPLME